MHKDLQKKKGKLNNYARYSGVAFQMIAIILLGVFGGIKIDKALKNLEFPLFTIILSFLGVILAVYYVIKDLINSK